MSLDHPLQMRLISPFPPSQTRRPVSYVQTKTLKRKRWVGGWKSLMRPLPTAAFTLVRRGEPELDPSAQSNWVTRGQPLRVMRSRPHYTTMIDPWPKNPKNNKANLKRNPALFAISDKIKSGSREGRLGCRPHQMMCLSPANPKDPETAKPHGANKTGWGTTLLQTTNKLQTAQPRSNPAMFAPASEKKTKEFVKYL